MADLHQILALMRRGTQAAVGATGPQEILGALGLAKNAVTGNAHNLRLGPEGEVMYDARDPNAAASAMGSFVQTDPSSGGDPELLKHEMRHVRQSDILGPLYLPAALGEQLSNYGAGPLERDAIKHATPQSELLRKGSGMYTSPTMPLGGAYLRGLLGD